MPELADLPAVHRAAAGGSTLQYGMTAIARDGVAGMHCLEVKVEGAKFVFPRALSAVQAGDEVLVYASVPEGQAVRLSVGGGPWIAPEATRAERPLLERAVVPSGVLVTAAFG